MSKVLKILDCKDDYKFQGPRFISLGPESGEEFRDSFFIPWLNENKDETDLTVDFSGTIVYTPSFLEETFGGAIRKGFVNIEKISLINLPKEQEEKIKKYINDALKTKD